MAFSNPELIIRNAGIFDGMAVADFGCGVGYYTFPLARKVGDGGRVYAIDIQRGLIEALKRSADAGGYRMIDCIVGDIDEPGGTKLKDGVADIVVLANVLSQVDDLPALAAEARRVLAKGGRALVVDWNDSFGGVGPHPEDVVARKEADGLFRDAGFSFERAIPDAGDHHYGLVYSKQ